MSLLPGGDPYIPTLEVSAGISWVLSVWFVAVAIGVYLRKNGAEHPAAGMLWPGPSYPRHHSPSASPPPTCVPTCAAILTYSAIPTRAARPTCAVLTCLPNLPAPHVTCAPAAGVLWAFALSMLFEGV